MARKDKAELRTQGIGWWLSRHSELVDESKLDGCGRESERRKMAASFRLYAIHYLCLPNHVFIWACDKLVATPMLKL